MTAGWWGWGVGGEGMEGLRKRGKGLIVMDKSVVIVGKSRF